MYYPAAKFGDDMFSSFCFRVLTYIHTKALSFGDTAFAAAGPGLWNSLPPHLRDADLPYSRFRRSLKTVLFG